MSEIVLAASACRTTITEVIQSSSGSLPVAGNWGCESTSGTAQSKYVASVNTTANGVILVTAAATGITTGVDGLVLSLAPLTEANAVPTAGTTVNKWRCGATADGTTINVKYLPGSCRGAN